MDRRSKSGSRKMTRYESTSPIPIGEITEDGILADILSSLTVREAVRTSILSSRWRHIWRSLPNLKFTLSNMFEKDEYRDKHGNIIVYNAEEVNGILEGRAHRFIERVNKFLQSHHGVGVKTFEVQLFLHKEHADHLDKWVDFAITSGAQDLRLTLVDDSSRWCAHHLPTTNLYEFPFQLFTGGRGSSIESLFLGYCALSVPPNFNGFRSLKVLELSSVDVNDGDIQGLLSTCSVLEHLCIHLCSKLVNLRISNPSGRLKFVYITSWFSLVRLEVCAENLTTFEYFGRKVSILFREAHQVTRAYIGFFEPADTLGYFLTGLQDDLPLLENLILEVEDSLDIFPVDNLPVNPRTFAHLKDLVLTIPLGGFHWVASILSAAPFLKKFQLNFFVGRSTVTNMDDLSRIRRLHASPRHHHHLKAIKITGFTGIKTQIEFARYMLKNAVVLELMTICSRNRYYMGAFKWRIYDDKRPLRRKIREKILASLHGQGPPGAKLVIM